MVAAPTAAATSSLGRSARPPRWRRTPRARTASTSPACIGHDRRHAPISDLFSLDGKVAIVTGASSGLGVAFAQGLAEAGADVALGARRVDRMAETARLVEEAGRRSITVETDVASPEACQALVDGGDGPSSAASTC